MTCDTRRADSLPLPSSPLSSYLVMSRVSCVFSRASESLRYFHAEHRRSMSALIAEADAAMGPDDLTRLGSAMSSFARGLDMHHRIEDAQMFPLMSGKVDMTQLEADHHSLEAVLTRVSKLATKLRKMDSMLQFDRKETLELLRSMETMVNEHEKAEEAVFSKENMKKHCTAEELRKFG